MWAVQFFVYALIVWLLMLALVGSSIGYYFTKKAEYEMNKIVKMAEVLKKKSEGSESSGA